MNEPFVFCLKTIVDWKSLSSTLFTLNAIYKYPQLDEEGGTEPTKLLRNETVMWLPNSSSMSFPAAVWLASQAGGKVALQDQLRGPLSYAQKRFNPVKTFLRSIRFMYEPQ